MAQHFMDYEIIDCKPESVKFYAIYSVFCKNGEFIEGKVYAGEMCGILYNFFFIVTPESWKIIIWAPRDESKLEDPQPVYGH